MKNWRKILSLVFCMLLAVHSLPIMASAKDYDVHEITYYADGSYTVTTITYDEPQEGVSFRTARSTKSGTKTRDHYDSSHELLWSFSVHGTFTYDGSSAKATSADYSYKIYNSAWSFVRASASCSGASAQAAGTFKLILSTSITVSLTCSANGVLS